MIEVPHLGVNKLIHKETLKIKVPSKHWFPKSADFVMDIQLMLKGVNWMGLFLC